MSAIVAFDTSGPWIAAALHCADQRTARHISIARGQAEKLMDYLADMLQTAGLGWGDVSALAVGIGPGNFTGIRIAVSAARGLALGLSVPAIGVSMFETTRYLSGALRVMVPGPRGYCYVSDPDRGLDPIRCAEPTSDIPVSSQTFDPTAHVQAMAEIASTRLLQQEVFAPPAPLYIAPPNAQPKADTGLRLI